MSSIRNDINIPREINLPESVLEIYSSNSNCTSPVSPEICYICHEGNNYGNLIENPCGHCSMKVHYNCLLSHLIANWSMQEDGYSYKNCSVCRRRYPNFIIRDMLAELDALEENQSSPIRNYENNNYSENINNENPNNNNIINQNFNRNNRQNYQRVSGFKCFETLVLFGFLILIFYYSYKMIFDFYFGHNYIFYKNNNTKMLEIVNNHNNNVISLLIILLILLFLTFIKKIFTNQT